MHLGTLGTPLLAAALLSFLTGSLLGFSGPAASRRLARASLLLDLLGCAFLVPFALGVLLGGSGVTFPVSLPGFSTISPSLSLGLGVDSLSALFVFLLGFVGFAITLASLGYVPEYVHERPATLAGFYGLFLLSMLLVLLAETTFLFLVGWEAMTLVSYFLVVHEHGSWEVRKAGLSYLVMSHAAAASLLAGLILLTVDTGQFSFVPMSHAAALVPPVWQDVIFVALLIGFGTKAGLVPLHTWLPEAHPSAPSNVSALMSGVMIKIGIYGILRFVFLVLGGGQLWWGFTLITLGAVSALVGILNAIAQHDLKRLLAFSSVENIGIIFMALGASLVFQALGSPVLAALALLAGLFHTFNHALFKGLLFLGAGAVVGAVGTRNMEKMGGLARSMPGTAGTFLVGAMAISALPPFNGFVSEWLLFQAFFGSFATGSLATEMTFTATAAVLALASGLAAYCFVKAFGMTFLARPRSPEARGVVRDAPLAQRVGMGLMAGTCLTLGIIPVLAFPLFGGTLTELVHSGLPSYSALSWLGTLPRPSPSASGAGGTVALGVVALVLAAGILVAWALRRLGAPRPDPREAMWDCGMESPTPRMEYTASGYAQPILRIFSAYYGPREHAETTIRGGSRPGILATTGHFETEVSYPLVEQIYSPLTRSIVGFSRRFSRLQSGGIHAYLGYMILTLVVLLIAVRVAGGIFP